MNFGSGLKISLIHLISAHRNILLEILTYSALELLNRPALIDRFKLQFDDLLVKAIILDLELLSFSSKGVIAFLVVFKNLNLALQDLQLFVLEFKVLMKQCFVRLELLQLERLYQKGVGMV